MKLFELRGDIRTTEPTHCTSLIIKQEHLLSFSKRKRHIVTLRKLGRSQDLLQGGTIQRGVGPNDARGTSLWGGGN